MLKRCKKKKNVLSIQFTVQFFHHYKTKIYLFHLSNFFMKEKYIEKKNLDEQIMR